MKIIKSRNALTLLVLFGLLGGMNQELAALPRAASATELSRLPIFCQVKLGFPLNARQENVKLYSGKIVEVKLYAGKIGPDWLHIHHYCIGLTAANRYHGSFGDEAAKRSYFKDAIDNIDYVFNHASPTFWMRPEMHVQKGKLLASAQRNIEAVREFEQALQIESSYVEAYVALSDLYERAGQKLKSLTALEQGLRLAPNSKSMQRRYNQLTGKVFTPPPPPPPPPPLPMVEQTVQTPSTPTSVVQAAVTSGVNSTTTQPVSASSPAVVPEKIGTSSNKYCRFCPPE